MATKKPIYLDYAATTPIDPDVLRAMLPYLKEDYGNPSSIHQLGQRALMAIDKAREQVANFLNCQAEEIVFTGSATEADNLAIKGVIEALKFKVKEEKFHIITSSIEHHAVLEPCHQLEKRGLAKVTYLPVNKEGFVAPADVRKAIQENTALVSIMYANNEVGTIQPIAEIGKLIKKINEKRVKFKIFFHSDAVQAINYLNSDVQHLGVDLLTLSAHKIYGPKGVGALFVRKGTPLEPLIFGGGHEFGIRSGTENVPGIVGLGKAIEKIKRMRSEGARLEKLRDKLIEGILKNIPDCQLNGSRQKRLPNNVNVSFKGAEGEAMVIALDQEGICVSTGSACSSKSLEPSHVLLALGLSPEQAHGSLRLSLGRFTTEAEIDKVLKTLPPIVARLRKFSGYS